MSLRNHLGVRDVLRSDDALRDAYGVLKTTLAKESVHMAAYIEGKTSFLQVVLSRAGLSEQDLSEIEQANRQPNLGG